MVFWAGFSVENKVKDMSMDQSGPGIASRVSSGFSVENKV